MFVSYVGEHGPLCSARVPHLPLTVHAYTLLYENGHSWAHACVHAPCVHVRTHNPHAYSRSLCSSLAVSIKEPAFSLARPCREHASVTNCLEKDRGRARLCCVYTMRLMSW